MSRRTRAPLLYPATTYGRWLQVAVATPAGNSASLCLWQWKSAAALFCAAAPGKHRAH
jgi:hypothetical protein